MIIDTHTHFGDPAHPNPLLYRTVLPQVYKDVAIPEGVTGTIHTETAREIEENQWIIGLAEEDPFIVGLVGHLDPFSDRFASDLERDAASPIFRGIRLHMNCCHEYSGHPRQSLDNISEKLLESLELLRVRDLVLDFHGGHAELGYVAEIVRRLPGLPVVLNHIAEGSPIDGGPPDPEWVRNMRAIAVVPSICCKVSALVQMAATVPAPADVEFYRPTLDVLWNLFGEDRLIYASNWPQIERVSDFATAHDIVARYFEGKGVGSTEKYFWRNAKSVYRWVDRV